MRFSGLLMLTVAASGEQARADRLTELQVCLSSSADVRVSQARQIATLILASAGVALEWSPRARCTTGSVVITLQDKTRSDEPAEWFAYAQPFEGIHITVFFDRVQSNVVPRQVPVVLGHVFAHEIVHILEGTNDHSSEGIMKVHWNGADFRKMESRRLRFTAADLDLIHAGLEARTARQLITYGR
jgi:hypothetical protein